MNLHRQTVSSAADPDDQIVLRLDNAGWHVSKSLRVPANITVVPLPSCSPELNARERLWLSPRSHYWANRLYADHDALYAAGCDAGNRFSADPQRVRTVCHAAWTESAYSN